MSDPEKIASVTDINRYLGRKMFERQLAWKRKSELLGTIGIYDKSPAQLLAMAELALSPTLRLVTDEDPQVSQPRASLDQPLDSA